MKVQITYKNAENNNGILEMFVSHYIQKNNFCFDTMDELATALLVSKVNDFLADGLNFDDKNLYGTKFFPQKTIAVYRNFVDHVEPAIMKMIKPLLADALSIRAVYDNHVINFVSNLASEKFETYFRIDDCDIHYIDKNFQSPFVNVMGSGEPILAGYLENSIKAILSLSAPAFNGKLHLQTYKAIISLFADYGMNTKRENFSPIGFNLASVKMDIKPSLIEIIRGSYIIRIRPEIEFPMVCDIETIQKESCEIDRFSVSLLDESNAWMPEKLRGLNKTNAVLWSQMDKEDQKVIETLLEINPRESRFVTSFNQKFEMYYMYGLSILESEIEDWKVISNTFLFAVEYYGRSSLTKIAGKNCLFSVDAVFPESKSENKFHMVSNTNPIVKEAIEKQIDWLKSVLPR